MIGVFTTSVLIVGVAAVLTRQAHHRRLTAEAEVAVLQVRDRRRQAWIDDAWATIWRLADRDEQLDPRDQALLREVLDCAHLKELRADSADHVGAVRIAKARLAHGMEVTA